MDRAAVRAEVGAGLPAPLAVGREHVESLVWEMYSARNVTHCWALGLGTDSEFQAACIHVSHYNERRMEHAVPHGLLCTTGCARLGGAGRTGEGAPSVVESFPADVHAIVVLFLTARLGARCAASSWRTGTVPDTAHAYGDPAS